MFNIYEIMLSLWGKSLRFQTYIRTLFSAQRIICCTKELIRHDSEMLYTLGDDCIE